MRTVLVYPDADAVAESTGARLLLALADAVAVRGVAHVVLTGGTVGVELLRRAARSPLAGLVDWTSVHVWWGDERFVPAGHPDRNELQAQEALLSAVPLAEDTIHRMGASDVFVRAEDAAQAYDTLIAHHGNPAWDVLLLGMGPDGHVASLFPGHPTYRALGASAAREAASAVPVENSPKPPPTRVSLTLSALNRARETWVVAAGAEKAPAVADALRAGSALPAAQVHGTERTLWVLDAAAATLI